MTSSLNQSPCRQHRLALLALVVAALACGDSPTSPTPEPEPDPRFAIPGPFGFPVIQTLGGTLPDPYTVHLIDVNGDGRADLVFNHVSATSNQVGVALAQADGSFGSTSVYVQTQPLPGTDGWADYVVRTGDITGDGRIDLVWYSLDRPYRVYTAVATTSGGFTFPERTQLPELLSTDFQLVLADVDADGAKDLVWNRTNQNSNRTWIAASDRNGGFRLTGMMPLDNSQGAGWAPYQLLVLDNNNDGRDDLIWNARTGSNRSYLGVAKPNLTLDFRPAFDLPFPGTNWVGTTMRIGHFSGPGYGHPLWYRSEASSATVWRAFSNDGLYANAPPQVMPASEIGPGPHRGLVGDVDGDGKDDLIWNHVNGHGTALMVSRGTSGPLFDTSWPVQQHPDPAAWDGTATMVGDINGDGRADVLWFFHGAAPRVAVALARQWP